jgi:hypothetical protein
MGDREPRYETAVSAISVLTADFEVFMRLGMLSFLARRRRIHARRHSARTWDMR